MTLGFAEDKTTQMTENKKKPDEARIALKHEK